MFSMGDEITSSKRLDEKHLGTFVHTLFATTTITSTTTTMLSISRRSTPIAVGDSAADVVGSYIGEYSPKNRVSRQLRFFHCPPTSTGFVDLYGCVAFMSNCSQLSCRLWHGQLCQQHDCGALR